MAAAGCVCLDWEGLCYSEFLIFLLVFLPAQMAQQRWWEQEIPVDWTINKGELMTHNLTELVKPESYEVRLTPITRFGEGDSTVRIITYSGTSAPASCRFFNIWETLHTQKHTHTHSAAEDISELN